jgi:RimJ/RimL family protein N-acetyltransferase
MHIHLETERLILRRATLADLDDLVALDGDPEVMRYLSGGPPTPRAVIEHDYLPHWLAYYERGGAFGFWIAIEKASGDFLGWVHFRPPDAAVPDNVELGYRLRRAAWGKGYATEASRALIDKGFAEQGIRRVFATTYQDNLGSRRVMEKLGMTLARTFKPTPEELAAHGLNASSEAFFPGDDVEYALARDEWERREAAGARRYNHGGGICHEGR